MMSAIDTAVRAAGKTTVEEGGTISVKFSGLGKVTRAGKNAPKLYTATYTPPPAGFALRNDDDFAAAGGDDFAGAEVEPF
jgi:hypothetical protein